MARIKAYFTIGAPKLSFVEITNSIGVIPTNVRRKEDWPLPSIIAGIAEDVWIFSLENEYSNCVSQSIQKLCQIFGPKVSEIRQLCDHFCATAHVEVVIHTEENSLPEMFLSTENIRFLNELRAEIGFDVYFDL